MAKSAEELKKLTLEEFQKEAGQFDNNDPSIYNLCRKDYPEILAEIEKEPFTDLLDAGCGTGAVISLLADKYPDKHYTGIDISPNMIEVAKSKSSSNSAFVCGDCEQLPFDENSFDVITCSMSFHHYPHPEKFFTSCYRVLRPNGRLINKRYDSCTCFSVVCKSCRNTFSPSYREGRCGLLWEKGFGKILQTIGA